MFQRWGEVTKPVRDTDEIHVKLYRYRCDECKRTFRDYPLGIDRSDFSRSTKQLAALIWALGYSHRDVIKLFEKYGIALSRSTVWREGQALAARLDGIELNSHRKMFTIDKRYIHRISATFGVVLAVDIGDGRYAILGTLNEHDPRSIQYWLQPLVRDADIEIFQLATEKLDLLFGSEGLQTGDLLA